MKVVLNQFQVTSDVEDNLNLVRQGFQMFSEADLHVAPELFTSGFRYQELKKYSALNVEALKTIMGWCSQYKTAFAGSFLWEEKNTYRNRLIFIDNKGNIAAYYDKSHLIPAFKEPQYLTPGKDPVVLKHLNHIIGLSVCYDLRFPELFRFYGSLEAEVMIVVSQWPTIREDQMVTLAKARAIENQAYVILVNAVGLCRDTHMAGRSMAIDPRGNEMVDMRRTHGPAMVELDFAALRSYRSEFPALYQYSGRK